MNMEPHTIGLCVHLSDDNYITKVELISHTYAACRDSGIGDEDPYYYFEAGEIKDAVRDYLDDMLE